MALKPDMTPIWQALGTNLTDRIMDELRALANTIDPVPPTLIEATINAFSIRTLTAQ